MPEGDAVRRLADTFDDVFVGQRVRASSPQGRFAAGAAILDGQVLHQARAVGKHLFLGFISLEDAEKTGDQGADQTGDVWPDQWVHIHLGLYGWWKFSGDASIIDSGHGVMRRLTQAKPAGSNHTEQKWTLGYTAVVVAVSAALFLVRPAPGYLWLGIVLLGIGNIFFELASVNYNAILNHLATKDRIGAVSGLGWGMGYLGGIVLLLILYVTLVGPSPLLSFPAGTGMGVRVAMLVSAAWFGLSALPVLINRSRRLGRRPGAGGTRQGETVVPAEPARERAGMEGEPDEAVFQGGRRKESVLTSYRLLWRTLLQLYHFQPRLLWFLLAAAVFRDGLAGVFTYGGIIAQNTFGFSSGDVIIFAIVANIVAGVATIGAGRLDDRFGPRNVIMASLTILVVAGLLVFLLHSAGTVAFWVLGLLLSACVGPAQSAARSFLARLIPEGQEGEIFGLYATTGRAVSFMAPMMYGIFIYLGTGVVGPGANYWGILGIVAVLATGLLLMLRVGNPVDDAHKEAMAV